MPTEEEPVAEKDKRVHGREFEEIAHSGGQVITRVGKGPDGRRGYQLTWQHSRPVPAVIFAVYGLPQGVPVSPVRLGGIGQPFDPPPIPACYLVFIGSDSEGKFGRECPACAGNWRCLAEPTTCPYCGMRAQPLQFLTKAQSLYVQQYCHRLSEVLCADQDGEYVIDMDAVAEAAGKGTEKPPFYYADQSQQNKFTCNACGEFNDILGTFGYCSVCGTRNDLQEFEGNIIPRLRDRINTGRPYEACVRDAVASFDSFAGQHASQLLRRVPMGPGRKGRFEKMRFHNLRAVAIEIKAAFDIDIFDDLKPEEIDFAVLMFYRRHVYEHKGGEADEKYIAESGDRSVRPKQALHETQDSAHRLTGLVVKMARNLHRGFHEIFPPEPGPIQRHHKHTIEPTAARPK